MSENIKKDEFDVGTTGHVWDDDLTEYNNPLPRWWLFSFYGTVVFSLIYWVIYPTWPLPNGWTKGMKEYSLVMPDKTTKTVTWSSRAVMINDLQNSPEAGLRNANFDKIMGMSPEEVLQDQQMMNFSRQTGKVLFTDNCATCHGTGAQGLMGFYPNLTDNAWLWGGEVKQLEATITQGRTGNMTAMRPVGGVAILSEAEISDVARYALTLSNNYVADEASARGEEIFKGKGTCITCHQPDGTGQPLLGGANLTDQIWELVDIPSVNTPEEKIALVITHVSNGVIPATTARVMPTWKGRLSPAEIRALAVYVHQLGGGQ